MKGTIKRLSNLKLNSITFQLFQSKYQEIYKRNNSFFSRYLFIFILSFVTKTCPQVLLTK